MVSPVKIATLRQRRGLLIAWANRPSYLRQKAEWGIQQVRRQDSLGMVTYSERRYSLYRRLALPTFGRLYGRELEGHRGCCRWCKRAVSEDRRSLWHEACLPAYWAATGQQNLVIGYLHTRADASEEVPRCATCGTADAIWFDIRMRRHPELIDVSLRDSALALEFGGQGPVRGGRRILLATATVHPAYYGNLRALELDHADALSVAWASGDERRMVRALMLDNLRWLCHDCHKVKTGEDRRRMHNLLDGLDEDHRPPRAERKPSVVSPLQGAFAI